MAKGAAELFLLVGHVAVVTAATGTVGAHFAHVLHGVGDSVVLAARRAEALNPHAAELGERALTVALDVTHEEAVAAYDAAEARFGQPCDVIINNACVAVTKPMLQQTVADFDQVIGVNLRGCFLVAQEDARRLGTARHPDAIIIDPPVIVLT